MMAINWMLLQRETRQVEQEGCAVGRKGPTWVETSHGDDGRSSLELGRRHSETELEKNLFLEPTLIDDGVASVHHLGNVPT
jgi:hypothetical protein